jgi:hypothetical protein
MNKMKTKINITNYLTKGVILASVAVSLMLNTSAQKIQDFVNAEKYASAQIMANELTRDNDKNISSTAAPKKANTEVSLEAFLIKAAGLNSIISANEMETSDVKTNDESVSLEQFLITAAGLNQVENSNSDENVITSDKEVENFLIHAASLNSIQNTNILSTDSENESQEMDNTDFLLNAAGLNTYITSIME